MKGEQREYFVLTTLVFQTMILCQQTMQRVIKNKMKNPTLPVTASKRKPSGVRLSANH